tara:strand:+ start:61 stop:639 length:579 start_codon:yes stop_codon:yes gene_type:complete
MVHELDKIKELKEKRTLLREKYYKETKIISNKINVLDAALVKRGNPRLNEDRDKLITKEYIDGNFLEGDTLTYVSIGKKYNISSGRIAEIVHREHRRMYILSYRGRNLNTQKLKESDLKSKVSDILNLSSRVLKGLSLGGIDYISELIECSSMDIALIRNIGRTSRFEIQCELHKIGRDLKEYDRLKPHRWG